MTDKYIGLEQYKRSIDSIKEYVDKSIPHFAEPEVIFTLPADKVLEIYNSDIGVMEFDKPSNINLDYNFIVSYNNEDITDISIKHNGDFKTIFLYNNNIVIRFAPGFDINQNINENKMTVAIEELNTDITPTDVVLKQIKIIYLNNKYLKNNVAIRNSITIGSRLKRKGYDIGLYSFSNGKNNISSGNYSHAEGLCIIATGDSSHAEGSLTEASGHSSHAEGFNAIASGYHAHAEGHYTKASGDNSHAEGQNTRASGNRAHAEGHYTRASGDNSHVQGKYNIEDTENKYAHIIGNGTSNTTRTNAHTVDWQGNAWYSGNVSIDGTPTNNKDLTTKKYVDDRFVNIDIASTSWVQNSGGLYELTYTHNLASENITVQVYNTDSKYEMFVDTQIVDSNSIKITSDENPNCAIRIVKF